MPDQDETQQEIPDGIVLELGLAAAARERAYKALCGVRADIMPIDQGRKTVENFLSADERFVNAWGAAAAYRMADNEGATPLLRVEYAWANSRGQVGKGRFKTLSELVAQDSRDDSQPCAVETNRRTGEIVESRPLNDIEMSEYTILKSAGGEDSNPASSKQPGGSSHVPHPEAASGDGEVSPPDADSSPQAEQSGGQS